MFNLLYLLFYCTYQIFEAWTEAYTAMKGNWNNNPKINGAKYHTLRLGEDVGIHGISLLTFITKYGFISGIINYFFIMLIGTRLYDFIFCQIAHDNWLFERNWKWEYKVPFTNKVKYITYMKSYQKIIVLVIGIIGFIVNQFIVI